ncbi:hypothetical protein Srut_26570 [Streptomyces rutgersensis]|uniref:hypothetical protein n=1 Tax=Streptomyces rutgersensis TaxID=53451 RepID=UPI0013C9D281|nr:hypothetical protein [Streptomyces rutgersensis]GFH66143.1 hypothetical protein Srut_26570 [Streptomyces rutgersensis]
MSEAVRADGVLRLVLALPGRWTPSGRADGGTEAVLSAPDADVARFREASAPALARGRPEARPGPAAL